MPLRSAKNPQNFSDLGVCGMSVSSGDDGSLSETDDVDHEGHKDV
jgi:hypothetical protein